MGVVYRKQYTTPFPPRSEIVDLGERRIARWRVRNGPLRTDEVVDCQDGEVRVRGRSKFYTARYRNGEIVEVTTQCRDLIAARSVLARPERHAGQSVGTWFMRAD